MTFFLKHTDLTPHPNFFIPKLIMLLQTYLKKMYMSQTSKLLILRLVLHQEAQII